MTTRMTLSLFVDFRSSYRVFATVYTSLAIHADDYSLNALQLPTGGGGWAG